MNEKKLTDEDVIKAVENCLYGDYKTKCKECPYDNSEGYCQDMDRALLSIIYRLQGENERISKKAVALEVETNNQNAEIERLKKRHGVALLRNDDLDLENQRKKLQKQVDELTNENKELWNSYHKGYQVGYEYGKQDALTADRKEDCTVQSETSAYDKAVKETAKEICDLIIEHWEKKQFVECDWLRVAIAEKYGVEVK